MNSVKYFCLIAVVLWLTACASGSNVDGVGPGEFDEEKAAKTRISLGLNYLKSGNYSQAKFNLDKALQFAPHIADAHYSLAYYYQVVGEVELAEDAYKEAISRDRTNADIANSYGAFLCQQGDYAKAKRYFLSAVRTTSYNNVAETYENLAICSQTQEKYEDAVVYLSSAINHQPRRAKSLRLMTELLVKTEQWPQAKTYLQRYDRVSRVSPESLWLWVQIEDGLNNREGAEGYGNIMLQMFPGHELTKSFLALERSEPEPVKASKPELKIVRKESVSQPEKPQVIAETAEVNPEEAVPDTKDRTKDVVEDEVLYHTVAAGENLYRISIKYNVKMQRIIEWNGLASASSIYAGKKLRVSPLPLNIKEQ
ncbi:type IV pilus biogenesis/stability protein PilW [Alteromonadaceae bacterium M269]|nr:type IV pilus biogenesis/stability protein PilW [Alteromonadaceae bacterium M269]